MATIHSSLLLLFLLLGLASCEDLQAKCTPEVTKLMPCLNYATAKAEAPSPDCCTSVTGIHVNDPACLCFMIQQVSKGGPNVQNLGLQIPRLLKLPQDCKIAGADVHKCPKLLNLSPSSPDNALFANTTKVTSASPTTQSSNVETKSEGVMHQIQLGCTFAVIAASAIFISM